MGSVDKAIGKESGATPRDIAHVFWTCSLQLRYKAPEEVESELPSAQLLGVHAVTSAPVPNCDVVVIRDGEKCA